MLENNKAKTDYQNKVIRFVPSANDKRKVYIESPYLEVLYSDYLKRKANFEKKYLGDVKVLESKSESLVTEFADITSKLASRPVGELDERTRYYLEQEMNRYLERLVTIYEELASIDSAISHNYELYKSIALKTHSKIKKKAMKYIRAIPIPEEYQTCKVSVRFSAKLTDAFEAYKIFDDARHKILELKLEEGYIHA